MANVEIQMDALKKRLTKMRSNLKNPSPIMQKTSLYMYKDVLNHFADEKSDNSNWVPLKYRSGKPLQDTGNLKRSIQASNTKDTSIVSAGNADVDYAGYQNFGTKTIPARKFMWISKNARGYIKNILGKFFIAE